MHKYKVTEFDFRNSHLQTKLTEMWPAVACGIGCNKGGALRGQGYILRIKLMQAARGL